MPGAFNRDALVAILNDSDPFRETWSLGLYKNNVTPDDETVFADLVEADFDGYSRIDLDNWGAAFENAAGIAESDEQLRVFSCTGSTTANDIYGYFLMAPGSTYLGAQRNPAGPTTIDTAGQTYPVQPVVTLENGT